MRPPPDEARSRPASSASDGAGSTAGTVLAPHAGMEGIVFCGIQASGKSTFYREHFFDTHVRISLDMLRTRRRERLLLAACLEAQQPFVIDNTNPTVAERAVYIAPTLAAGFTVMGYFFATDPRAAFERNRRRTGRALVPAAGLFGTQKRLQLPSLDEGFRRIERVEIVGRGFRVRPWLPAEPPEEVPPSPPPSPSPPAGPAPA